MRRNWRLTLGFFLALTTGCASTSLYGTSTSRPAFFGMAVKRADKAGEAFSNVRLKLDNTIGYSYNQNIADKDVTARAWFDAFGINMSIQNGGSTPIGFNYFTDKYYIKTDQGRLFELDKKDILIYPSKVLNPGESLAVSLRLPNKRQDEKAALLVAELNYGRTILALRPIEVVEVREDSEKAKQSRP